MATLCVALLERHNDRSLTRRPIATGVAWSVRLCICAGSSLPQVVLKRLNRSGCCPGCGLGWEQEQRSIRIVLLEQHNAATAN